MMHQLHPTSGKITVKICGANLEKIGVDTGSMKKLMSRTSVESMHFFKYRKKTIRKKLAAGNPLPAFEPSTILYVGVLIT